MSRIYIHNRYKLIQPAHNTCILLNIYFDAILRKTQNVYIAQKKHNIYSFCCKSPKIPNKQTNNPSLLISLV